MTAPRGAVTSSPAILGGAPVFPGTRVPVATLFDDLEEGRTIADFLAGFPSVTREHVIAVLKAARYSIAPRAA